jgi:hypothetical protein
MKTKSSLLMLWLIAIIILSTNCLPAESQWYSSPYSINIYITPNDPGGSGFYDLPFLGGRSTPFSYAFSPFFFGFDPGLSSWDFWDNSFANTPDEEPDNAEFYTVGSAGHAEAIMNGHLIICTGKLLKYPGEEDIFSVYHLKIINIEDPEGFNMVGELTFESESGLYGPAEVKKLVVEDSFAYILTNNPGGLYIIDMTNQESPELISYQDMNFVSAVDMEIFQGWAFIVFTDYDSLLGVWNISNPNNTTFLDTIVLKGWVKDIFVDQGLLFAIGDSSSGLNVVDISDPEDMKLLNHLDLCGEAVWMTGGGILTAGGDNDWMSKLRILDFRNQLDLTQVASQNLLGREKGVCGNGQTIYVLSTSAFTNMSRIYIFLMDEETLTLEFLKSLNVEGMCHDLKIYQDYLMAAKDGQLLFWNLTNPTDPEFLDIFEIETSDPFIYSDFKKINEDNTNFEKDSDYYAWPFNPFSWFMPNPFWDWFSWGQSSPSFFNPRSAWNRSFNNGWDDVLNSPWVYEKNIPVNPEENYGGISFWYYQNDAPGPSRSSSPFAYGESSSLSDLFFSLLGLTMNVLD